MSLHRQEPNRVKGPHEGQTDTDVITRVWD